MKKLIPFILCILTVTAFFFSALSLAGKSDFLLSSGTIRMQPTIVLDAGHGGFDGGASAIDGTPEKTFNLAIALKLRDALQLFGFRVIMTRTEDTGTEDAGLTTLREKKVSDIHNRMDIMNQAGECIFVSIHQNFFADASCHGTQVFYSGNHAESKRIAERLQSDISALLQPYNTRQVKKSGDSIYLLYHAEKPAVLVECGFISNAVDTANLKDESYQKQLAFCISRSLYNYVNTPEANNGAEK